MKKYEIVFGEERLITPTGMALAGILLDKTNLKKRIDTMKLKDLNKPHLKNSDIIYPYIGLLCQGKSDFDNINEMHEDEEFYTYALNINRIPSSSRLRQRMNMIGTKFTKIIFEENANLLKRANAPITPCYENYIPLDIDVSPFDNSNTKKEGVSYTYKGFNGYAPIFAYLGEEGYLINTELRAGSTHCQSGTDLFLSDTIKYAKKIIQHPVLLRMDSGNDSMDNIKVCKQKDTLCDFIIKRNLRKESIEAWYEVAKDQKIIESEPREGKKFYIGSTYKELKGMNDKVRIVFKVIERTITAEGQILIVPDIQVETYWTSLNVSENEIIQLYHNHGTSEQFHSEIKSDLDLERLPSGHFKTNALVLQLTTLAYNILRIIGQRSIKNDSYAEKRGIKRRRLKTVIKNFITIASHIVKHARKNYIKLGRSNFWRYKFKEIYNIYR